MPIFIFFIYCNKNKKCKRKKEPLVNAKILEQLQNIRKFVANKNLARLLCPFNAIHKVFFSVDETPLREGVTDSFVCNVSPKYKGFKGTDSIMDCCF